MVNIPLSSVSTYKYTAITDLLFHLVTINVWFSSANIHVVTNDALYGDVNSQDASILATHVVSFDDFNLKDLYFKNATGGNNTTIRVVGILMLDARKRELGLI